MFSIHAGPEPPAAQVGDMFINLDDDFIYVCTDTSPVMWTALSSGCGAAPLPEPQLGNQRCSYCDSLSVSGTLRCDSCGASF